jgi:large subunit ribosomal protein L15
MKLHQLSTIKHKEPKRLGRGHGSGKVKTAGRGQKGQKARGRVRLGFEGGQVSLQHRLPFLRGKGRNASQQEKVTAISLKRLFVYKAGETVSLETLHEKGLIGRYVTRVKLIGEQIDTALTVTVPTSAGAKSALEKAGGTVGR